MDEPLGETVVDRLLGGRLTLRQPARGHRAGTDAILLAAAAPVDCAGLDDLGAGVGTAGLAAAIARPELRVRLIEKDPAIADLARQNVEANALASRVNVIDVDILDASDRRRAGIEDASTDALICNPPYYRPREVRASPDPRRMASHIGVEDACGGIVEPWLRAFAALLRPDGRMVLIHRAEALGEILAGCEGRFGALTVRPIHARGDTPALRILVRGVKGSRAPLRLLPGLILHETSGFTPFAEAVHRGEARIDWA